MNVLKELKRRNVFRVGIAYIIGAWLFTQVADVVLGVISAPDSAMRAVVAILALGFIPTVIFSWVYEMTPDGVRKASEIDEDESITRQTGKKLNIATIIMVISAVGFVIFERYLPDSGNTASEETAFFVQEPQTDVTPTAFESEAPPATTIAVLPFANRSNQDDDLYFTDGVHDDLLTQLAKIQGLTVISRTSVMKYRDTTQTLGKIGAALKVGTILEGGVQKVGDRVRINAQLIEVATDRHLWAETFDRELTAENVFELQSEIARQIVNAVAVQLSPEEEQQLDAVPTKSLAAYDAYLRARSVFYGANYARSQEEEAMPFIQLAVELDPSYADAHALLSHIYSQLYWRGLDTSEEMLEKYRQSLDRASALNPNSPEALRARANYYYRVDTDYARSLELLEQAVALAPGNVDIHGDIGLSLRRLGRFEESIDSLQRALTLDPDNRFYRAIMLDTMVSVHKWQDVLANSVPLEDSPLDEIDIQVNRAEALFNLTGDLEPMIRVFERMNRVGTVAFADNSADVHLLRRDPDKAIEVLDDPLWNELVREPYNRIWRLFQLASAWRLKGDEEKARSFDAQIVAALDVIEGTNLQTRLICGPIIAVSMARLERNAEALALLYQISKENDYDNDALIWATPVYYGAMVRGLTGDADGAVADLQLMLNTSTDGWTKWDLHYDPNWDFMRDDPRFLELATPENLIQ